MTISKLVKVAEKDYNYRLQFFNRLKLCTEKSRNSTLRIYIKVYLQLFASINHLYYLCGIVNKITFFTIGTLKMTYRSIYKIINTSRNFI